jgi:transposase
MRFIALDVHRDFCEVAIAEGGRVRRAGRVVTTPATLELFAQSLAADDQVVLEVTGNALAIARIIEPYVDRVVLANPKAVKNATQTAKTDKLDARTLARLLAAGFLPELWRADERTRVLRRRICRRAQLVRQRTREKNQVHAILIRNLKQRSPAADLFGAAGRRWLARRVRKLVGRLRWLPPAPVVSALLSSIEWEAVLAVVVRVSRRPEPVRACAAAGPIGSLEGAGDPGPAS